MNLITVLPIFFLLSPVWSVHYVWEEPLISVEGKLLIVTWSTTEQTTPTEIKCGDQDVGTNGLNTKLFTFTDTKVIYETVYEVDISHCKEKMRDIRFIVAGRDYRMKVLSVEGIAEDVHSNHSFVTPICERESETVILDLPATDSANVPEVRYEYVCGSNRRRTQPKRTKINQTHTSESWYTHDGSECVEITVMSTHPRCLSSGESAHLEELGLKKKSTGFERLVAKSDEDCKPKLKEENKDHNLIEVRGISGQIICLDYKSGKNIIQNCILSRDQITEFKIPKLAKSVKTTCGFSIEKFSVLESQDMSCPFVFSEKVSVSICKDFPNPKLFWSSIFWLIVGIPLLWALNALTKLVYIRIQMKKLKTSGKCSWCNMHYSNIIDKEMHTDCLKCLCPYCGRLSMHTAELRNHVTHCGEREIRIKSCAELMIYKEENMRFQHDIVNSYSSCSMRSSYIFIAFLLLISSCIPLASAKPPRKCPYGSSGRCMLERVTDFAESLKNEMGSSRYTMPDIKDVTQNIPGPQADSGIEEEEEESEAQVFEMISEIYSTLVAAVENGDRKFEAINNRLDLIHHDIQVIQGDLAIQAKVRNVNSKEFIDSPHEEVTIKMNEEDINKLRVVIYNSISDIKGANVPFISQRHNNPRMSVPLANPQVQIPSPEQVGVSATGGAAINIASDAGTQVAAGSGFPMIASGNSQVARIEPSAVGSESVPLSQTSRERRKEAFNRFRETRRDKEWVVSNLKKRSKRSVHANAIRNFNIIRRQRLMDRRTKSQRTFVSNNSSQESQYNFIQRPRSENATEISSKRTILDKNIVREFSNPADLWHMHKPGTCHLSCLHVPGVCNCIDEFQHDLALVSVPWTTLNPSEIISKQGSTEFQEMFVREDVREDGTVIMEGAVEMEIEVIEGQGTTMKIASEKTAEQPELSLIIPEVSQIYKTKFLYHTCERKMTTEVKGLCTGECGTYCGGKACVGSKIWMFPDTRNWGCNPSWCFNIRGGCSCCGSNLECPKRSRIMSVWQVSYMRTEYIICLQMNKKTVSCNLISGTEEHKIGPFTLRATRPLEPMERIDGIIATIHDAYSKGSNSRILKQPSNVMLDPQVCGSTMSCSHGMVGDLQVHNIDCLHKVGTECYADSADLQHSECAKGVYFNTEGVDMTMTCHPGAWHTCRERNFVKELTFDDVIERSTELKSKYNLKMLKTNLNNNSLLMYINPKSSSGLTRIELTAEGLILAGKSLTPDISRFKVADCEGCYSCSTGFKCTASAESKSTEVFIMRLTSEKLGVSLTTDMIEIKPGKNLFKISGNSMIDVPKFDICLRHVDYKKCSKVHGNLHKATGEFIPSFEDSETSPLHETKESCDGWSWFGCFGNNVVSYFRGWKNWFYEAIYFFCGVIILILLMAWLPKLFACILMCRNSLRGKKMTIKIPTRIEMSDMLRKIRNKRIMSLKERAKKSDDIEAVPLFAEEELEE